MKNKIKLLIAFTLCLTLIFSVVSCDLLKNITNNNVDGEHEWHEGCIVPKGYTGGITYSRSLLLHHVVRWFETHEELMEVITLMKANDNEISQIPFFDCEEYGIDVKFCVVVPRTDDFVEDISYYNRKFTSVAVHSFIFFEDVTIAELEYSQYYDYEGMKLYASENIKNKIAEGNTNVDIYAESEEKLESYERADYYISVDGEVQFVLKQNVRGYSISDEKLEILRKTINVIEQA